MSANGPRDEGDDERTPPERVPIAYEPNRGLVLVLGHHALVLEQSAARCAELRDRIAVMAGPVAAPELNQIERVFRKQADSATDVARAAEKATG